MSEDQKDRFIDYLADRVTNLDLDKRAMELVLEDFLKTQQEMQKSMAALQADQHKLLSRLDEETRKRKAAERKAQRLDEQLKYANANRFGDKRQKVKKNSDLNRFWDELFAFWEDGELPIDNNLAERCIRKLTIQRNSMLHFGSDEGVEMVATYHSVISTVKLHGKSVWSYLGTFFTKSLTDVGNSYTLHLEISKWQYKAL